MVTPPDTGIGLHEAVGATPITSTSPTVMMTFWVKVMNRIESSGTMKSPSEKLWFTGRPTDPNGHSLLKGWLLPLIGEGKAVESESNADCISSNTVLNPSPLTVISSGVKGPPNIGRRSKRSGALITLSAFPSGL